MEISGKKAIVVGGASGMGEATVRALRAKEVRVAILDKDREKGAQLAADIGALFVPADVTDEDSIVDAFASARAANASRSP